MECNCIKGSYDFVFSTKGCNTFTYEDKSSWTEVPNEYEVQIISPGFNTGNVIKVKAKGVNELQSLRWQDGVYCFKVENCGVIYSKSVANTCELDCKLDHMIAQADLSNKDEFEKIQKIQFLLNSVKINAELNKPKKALEFFNLAAKELSCINCKC